MWGGLSHDFLPWNNVRKKSETKSRGFQNVKTDAAFLSERRRVRRYAGQSRGNAGFPDFDLSHIKQTIRPKCCPCTFSRFDEVNISFPPPSWSRKRFGFNKPCNYSRTPPWPIRFILRNSFSLQRLNFYHCSPKKSFPFPWSIPYQIEKPPR